MTPKGAVLLIEDDFDVREALGQVLEDAGYAVASAATGAEALRVLRAGYRPAVILLDLWMPDVDGPQFRAEQRRDEAIAAIPVIVVSADRGVEAKAREMGAAAFVAKPAHVDVLLRAIASAAPGAPPRRGDPRDASAAPVAR
jgi:CheY-like chemotaxis protein